MILFINPLDTLITFAIFDTQGGLVSKKEICSSGSDYENIPVAIVDTISTYSVDRILLLTGPGAFTRMRIMTLVINTIQLSHPGVKIWGMDFWRFSTSIGAPLPYILGANKKEALIFDGDTQRFVMLDQIPSGLYWGLGVASSREMKREVSYDFGDIQMRALLPHLGPSSCDPLVPIYIKEPHITCPKPR